MIFLGTVSEKCKERILKTEQKNAFFAGLCASIPFLIGNILLVIFDNYIFALFLPIWVAAPFLSGIRPSPKSYGLILPQMISIDSSVLCSSGVSYYETRKLDDVKKVVDYGEWYRIFFYFPYRSMRFVCQKDLIIEGTIEEFEELFADKMVRNF